MFLFLVDTGATLTWLSKEIAEDLALEPIGNIPLELADGNVTDSACLITMANRWRVT